MSLLESNADAVYRVYKELVEDTCLRLQHIVTNAQDGIRFPVMFEEILLTASTNYCTENYKTKK